MGGGDGEVYVGCVEREGMVEEEIYSWVYIGTDAEYSCDGLGEVETRRKSVGLGLYLNGGN